MRGTWYYDGTWIPLETEQSKVLEDVHLNLFQKQSPSQTTSACNTPSHSYKSMNFFSILHITVQPNVT